MNFIMMDQKNGLDISVEPRVENQGECDGSSSVPPISVAAPSTDLKKKRGRPRKYAPDGSVVALSPMPISASFPFTGEYSAMTQSSGGKVGAKKKAKLEFSRQGPAMEYSVGGNFTPHVITVNVGEDVSMRIMSFSQHGSRAICVLAANGAVSNVTLRQSDSSGGTLTYEGHFEILSLSGSFILNDDGLTKSRTGGMSVSLAGPDGHVFGGGLAGMLLAAGSVQVVIGSFVPGHPQLTKPKKPKYEQTIAFAPLSIPSVSDEGYEAAYDGPNQNPTTSFSFQGNTDFTSVNPILGSRIMDIDNNFSLTGEDSGEQSHEITC